MGGLAGGGAVDGRNHNRTECFEIALSLNPSRVEAWTSLGEQGGGSVDGDYYNGTECLQNACALEQLHAYTSSNLGSSGGGSVARAGIRYFIGLSVGIFAASGVKFAVLYY